MGAATRFVHNPGNTAICYYRYSSSAQRDVSIEQQQNAAWEYASKHGYHIIKEYSDRAMSGTRDDRPQFQLMLSEAETLRPAYLILWATDRLSRDEYDAPIAKAKMRACGVEIRYVSESIPEDDEAAKIIIEKVYEGIAASFIIKHRKNVMRGLTDNAQKCLYNGRKKFGYTGKSGQPYKIDETTAPFVQKIFKEYADGVPAQTICDELNEAGIKTTRGKDFQVSSIVRIVQNRSYIGEYIDMGVTVPDGMPRLIDDETFQKAQDRIIGNKRGGSGATKRREPKTEVIEDYWLSQKLVCGLCGSTMQGVSGVGKQGVIYYYYYCHNRRRRKSDCKLPHRRKELIEGIVAHTLDDLIRDPALRLIVAERCWAYHKSQNTDRPAMMESLKTQIRDIDAKLSNIMRAVEAGLFNDTTVTRMRELEEQKSRLTDALRTEENREKYGLKMEHIVKYLEGFVGDIQNPETRKNLLEILVDKIYVYPDKIVLTFYYSDDKTTLPFDQTTALLDNQKQILSMLDGTHTPDHVDPAKLQDITGGGEPDFFPVGVRPPKHSVHPMSKWTNTAANGRLSICRNVFGIVIPLSVYSDDGDGIRVSVTA